MVAVAAAARAAVAILQAELAHGPQESIVMKKADTARQLQEVTNGDSYVAHRPRGP